MYCFSNKGKSCFSVFSVQGDGNAVVTQLKTVLCTTLGDTVPQFLVLLHNLSNRLLLPSNSAFYSNSSAQMLPTRPCQKGPLGIPVAESEACLLAALFA